MYSKYFVVSSVMGMFLTLAYYEYASDRQPFLYANTCNRSKPPIPRQYSNAFILTTSCTGIRYNTTLTNLERSFSQLFRFHCCLLLSLNDSRVHPGDIISVKQRSSILVSIIQIWTYAIPKHTSSELQWSFIFEDDVNVIDMITTPHQISTWSNYTAMLQELMHDEEVQEKDGFFFLGIYSPLFNTTDRPLQYKSITNGTFFHYKGYGSCSHAFAITTRRARLFWTDISLFRSSQDDTGIDHYIYGYCSRGSHHFYTFAANKQWSNPPQHSGLVFQNRNAFQPLVNGIPSN